MAAAAEAEATMNASANVASKLRHGCVVDGPAVKQHDLKSRPTWIAGSLMRGRPWRHDLPWQTPRKDAMEFLREERSLESKYRKMNQPLSASAASDEGTAFTMGLQLGKQLEEIECAGRWKVLADLWTEMILYSAPSSNARDHIQHLANGGEFLTHLWALLSHAGILAREEQGFDKENTPL
nr:unnamed protein product [Digitaria exilis]